MEVRRTESDDNTVISALFMEIGISPSLDGFNYLKEAIFAYKKNNGIMGSVCAEVAKNNDIVTGISLNILVLPTLFASTPIVVDVSSIPTVKTPS